MDKHLKAKQSLGQNFLIEEYYVNKLIDSFNLQDGLPVLEIGPGKGALTKILVQKASHVLAIEIDSRMVEFLCSSIKTDNFKIICEDFLKVDLNNYFLPNQDFKILGNLPYHITSGIIFKIFDLVYEKKLSIKSLTIMIQKEVAERIIAVPSTKAYGILSIFSQIFARVEKLFDIPPTAFRPIPKVTSSLIRYNFDDCLDLEKIRDFKFFKLVIKTMFQKRRKMIRNSLKDLHFDLASLNDIDLTKRPEQFSIDELIDIYKQIELIKNN